MKKFIQFLKSPPTSKGQRLGLIMAVIISTLLMTFGFYGTSKQLGSMGVGSISSVGFRLNESVAHPQDETVAFQPEPFYMPDVSLTPWDGTSRVTILVMGLDYRDWSSGEGPSRTDTMMLLTLDPLSNSAGMLSIPRDLWVSIPGFENGRINTAYFLGEAYQLPGGGPALAVKTVEQLLGVTINYYAQIDFAAFVRFIDEIGGIKIDVPEKIKIDPIVGDPIFLKPERQTLFGELALAYARARNSEKGDLDRAVRQQQVIMGIRERMLSPEALAIMITNAPTLYAELIAGVQTNLQLDEAIKLALLAQKVPAGNIQRESISIPQVLLAESPDEQDILVPLPDKIR
ncbi:MAG: LCP family protein, partial [Chloroflexi bacterium]|nr:LCP family protein [Chloroflexota bacterium]